MTPPQVLRLGRFSWLFVLLLLPGTALARKRPDYECDKGGSGNCKSLEKPIVLKNHALPSEEPRYTITKDGFKLMTSSAKMNGNRNYSESSASRTDISFMKKRGDSYDQNIDSDDESVEMRRVSEVENGYRTETQNGFAKPNIVENLNSVSELAGASDLNRILVTEIMDISRNRVGPANVSEGIYAVTDQIRAGESEINSSSGREGKLPDARADDSQVGSIDGYNVPESRGNAYEGEVSHELNFRTKHVTPSGNGIVQNRAETKHSGLIEVNLPNEGEDREYPKGFSEDQRNLSQERSLILDPQEDKPDSEEYFDNTKDGVNGLTTFSMKTAKDMKSENSMHDETKENSELKMSVDLGSSLKNADIDHNNSYSSTTALSNSFDGDKITDYNSSSIPDLVGSSGEKTSSADVDSVTASKRMRDPSKKQNMPNSILGRDNVYRGNKYFKGKGNTKNTYYDLGKKKIDTKRYMQKDDTNLKLKSTDYDQEVKSSTVRNFDIIDEVSTKEMYNTNNFNNIPTGNSKIYKLQARRLFNPNKSSRIRVHNATEERNKNATEPKPRIIANKSSEIKNDYQHHSDNYYINRTFPHDQMDGDASYHHKHRSVIENEMAHGSNGTDLHQRISTVEQLLRQLLNSRTLQESNMTGGNGENYGLWDGKRADQVSSDRDRTIKRVQNVGQESDDNESVDNKTKNIFIHNENKEVPREETTLIRNNIIETKNKEGDVNSNQDNITGSRSFEENAGDIHEVQENSQSLGKNLTYGNVSDKINESVEFGNNIILFRMFNANSTHENTDNFRNEMNESGTIPTGVNLAEDKSTIQMRGNKTSQQVLYDTNDNLYKIDIINLSEIDKDHQISKFHHLLKNSKGKDAVKNEFKGDYSINKEDKLENTTTSIGLIEKMVNARDHNYDSDSNGKLQADLSRDRRKENKYENVSANVGNIGSDGNEISNTSENRDTVRNTRLTGIINKGNLGKLFDSEITGNLLSLIQRLSPKLKSFKGGSSPMPNKDGSDHSNVTNLLAVMANDSIDPYGSTATSNAFIDYRSFKDLFGPTYNVSDLGGAKDGNTTFVNEDDLNNANELVSKEINSSDIDNAVDSNYPQGIFDKISDTSRRSGYDGNTDSGSTRVFGVIYQTELPNGVRVDIAGISILSPGNAINFSTGGPLLSNTFTIQRSELSINLAGTPRSSNIYDIFETKDTVCIRRAPSYIQLPEIKEEIGLRNDIPFKNYLRHLDFRSSGKHSLSNENTEDSISSKEVHNHIHSSGKFGWNSRDSAFGPLLTHPVGLKRDADYALATRENDKNKKNNREKNFSEHSIIETKTTESGETDENGDLSIPFRDGLVTNKKKNEISTTGIPNRETTITEMATLKPTTVNNMRTVTFSEVSTEAMLEQTTEDKFRPNRGSSEMIADVSNFMFGRSSPVEGIGPPLVFDRAALLRQLRSSQVDNWLVVARLQVAAQFRDNLLKVFGYLLFRPSDTALDFTLYQALQDLYSAVRLRRVDIIDLVSILGKIRYVDAHQQFVSILRSMKKIVPRYLRVACSIWERALKTSFVDMNRMLRPDGGSFRVDFLEDLDSRVVDVLNVNSAETTRRSPKPKVTLRYKSQFLEEIVGGLFAGTMNLTLELTGGIMQHVQLRQLSPDSEESLRFIADLLTQGLPDLQFSIQKVSKENFYNPYKLIAEVLRRISSTNTSLDQNVVDAATIALSFIKLPDISTYSPNHDKVVAVMKTGQGRLDIKKLISRVIAPGEFPSDIVKAGETIWRSIKQGYINLRVVEKGFSAFQYATPAEMLLAFLQRLRQRRLVPPSLLNQLSAIIVHLRYKLAYPEMDNPVKTVPNDLAPIFHSFQTPDVPDVMRAGTLIIWNAVRSEANFDWEAVLHALESSVAYRPRQNFKTLLNCIIDQHLISDSDKERIMQNLIRVMDEDGDFKYCSSICTSGETISEMTESSLTETLSDTPSLIPTTKTITLEDIDLDGLFQAIDLPMEEDENIENLKTFVQDLIFMGNLTNIQPDNYKTKGELLKATLNSVLNSSEIMSNRTAKSWLMKVKGLVKLHGLGAQKWKKWIHYLDINSTLEALNTEKLSADNSSVILTRVLAFLRTNSQRIQWEDLKNLSSYTFLSEYFQRLGDLPNAAKGLREDIRILRQYLKKHGPGKKPTVIMKISL